MNRETLYTKINSYRKPKFNLRTEIAIESGKKYIYKVALYEEGKEFIQHIYNSYKKLSVLKLPFRITKCELIDEKTIRFDYIKGKTLLSEFEEVVKNDDLNKSVKKFEEFEELLNQLPSKKGKLARKFEKIFGFYGEEKEYELLLPGLLDLNLDNIIRDKDGVLHLIDYEWCFDFGIPKSYVFFRSIFNFFVSLKPSTHQTVNFEKTISDLQINNEDKEKFLDFEVKFQRYVFGSKITKSELMTHKDNEFKNLLTQETLVTTKSDINNQLSLLKKENDILQNQNDMLKNQNDTLKNPDDKLKNQNDKLKNQNDKLKNQNDKLKNQNNRILDEFNQILPDATEFKEFKQTKIWKGLTMYRKFKKYFKNFFVNIFRDGPILTFKRIYLRIHRKIDQYIKDQKQQREDEKRKRIEEEERKKEEERREIDENRYKYWLEANTITFKKRIEMWNEIRVLKYKPLISIVMPVYNVELKWIKEAVKSVKNQIYTNWELCIADDASTNEELKKYLKKISRHRKIKVVFREKNGHISEASNSALKLAKGEFVALMDNDDIIQPHALSETIKVLNKKKDTDFIYSDEDKINMQGIRVEPFFKPDWSPDLFLSVNYLCHLTVVRKELIDTVGGFRKGYEGSQDYDLFLRITEKTNKIEHIPDILYSWRKVPGSTATKYGQKKYADKTSIKALEDAIKRRSLDAIVESGILPGFFRVKYKIKGSPLVSIIIPTLDKYKYIKRCLSSLFDKTTYDNFEVIIIDTGSTDKKTLEYYKTIEDNPKVRFLDWNKKFNYSAVNNFGVKNSRGEYILLLNNDTEIISPDWIESMLEHAQREEIGAVGAKLYYPNNTIQHAGVILGTHGGAVIGAAGHAFVGLTKDLHPPSLEQKSVIRNYSAVTAACLMVNKKKFYNVNCLDENYRIAFNDVDFCLKLRKKGYYNLYTPYVELYHHESVSVGTPEKGTRDMKEFIKEVKMLNKKWSNWILNDPFYNKNLSLMNGLFQIKVDR